MNIYEKQHPAERWACSITYVNILTAEERWPGPLLISPVQMAIKERVPFCTAHAETLYGLFK